jgi:acylpyruvate hydrolase
MDWEAELALVIGARTRNVPSAEALSTLAGYTLINDVTARDWQARTSQWLQGKTFESTSPLGPYLYVPDDPREAFTVICEVNGETVQSGDTTDLVFGPADLIAYISSIVTLEPGDVIATGTPSGVGHARDPQRYLRRDDVVVTAAAQIGRCTNVCHGGWWDIGDSDQAMGGATA